MMLGAARKRARPGVRPPVPSSHQAVPWRPHVAGSHALPDHSKGMRHPDKYLWNAWRSQKQVSGLSQAISRSA